MKIVTFIKILRVKDIAHRATTDVALKALNISLQFSAQREQELKTEVARSRELVDIIQVKLTTIQRTVQDGANEASTLAEKVHLENELIDVKSRLIQMDSQLTDLKNLENVTSLQLKQMLDQEKELEISILHQEQQESRGTLESIETYFERSHETLEWERQFCKFKLEATSKLMESKLELIEATNNFSIRNLNNEIDTEKKKQKQYVDRVINLEDELEKSKTSYEIRIAAELSEKSRQLDAALRTTTTTTTARPTTTWTPPTGAVTLATGTYFFHKPHLTWTSAREHCQSLGMDLVAIETEEENKLLTERAKTIFGGKLLVHLDQRLLLEDRRRIGLAQHGEQSYLLDDDKSCLHERCFGMCRGRPISWIMGPEIDHKCTRFNM
ncbi:hypothetical protein B566_EDAN006285 [Ephemera danica]|nr:hypothetical protein B566_EDAN006285 [Ephemera danica]